MVAKKEITEYATTRLPVDFYRQLKSYALKEHRSLSGLIRLLLEEAWKRRGNVKIETAKT